MLEVDVDRGQVLLTAGTGDRLQVRRTVSAGRRAPAVEERADANGASLKSRCPALSGRACSVRYEIAVPAGYVIDVAATRRASRFTGSPSTSSRSRDPADRPSWRTSRARSRSTQPLDPSQEPGSGCASSWPARDRAAPVWTSPFHRSGSPRPRPAGRSRSGSPPATDLIESRPTADQARKTFRCRPIRPRPATSTCHPAAATSPYCRNDHPPAPHRPTNRRNPR